jgi:hypothetical protein
VGEKRNVYRILVGKPEGKRPLGRSRCRWVDNIKMVLRQIGWSEMDRIGLAQDREALVKTVMNLSGCVQCWEVVEHLHNW